MAPYYRRLAGSEGVACVLSGLEQGRTFVSYTPRYLPSTQDPNWRLLRACRKRFLHHSLSGAIFDARFCYIDASRFVCPTAAADSGLDPSQPWLAALRPPADSRRLLAPRSAWAILALASGEARFAARVADGLDAPEASRARARLKTDGLIALLPLLAARAGRAWCRVADPTAMARLLDDPRVLPSGHADQPTHPLQGYVRAFDLPDLVDDHRLQAPDTAVGRTILLRPVVDPWPFPDAALAAPALVQALDLLEVAAERRAVDPTQVRAAWHLIEQHAAQDVPSWYRATRPARAGPASRVAVVVPKQALQAPAAASATDADLVAAMLFAVGQPVRRADLRAASGWTPARLQAAVDLLLAEPPRGQQVLVDDDRLQLVTARTASSLVERLFTHLERGKILELLDLPETVCLVLAIVILDQPITRAEISARRMADSDRQVQVLVRRRLIREEPRAAVPGRGIPLVTTDLVLQRFGVRWIGELQDQLLAAAAEREPRPSPDTTLA